MSSTAFEQNYFSGGDSSKIPNYDLLSIFAILGGEQRFGF